MTEAEALAIAVKALVSAFVTEKPNEVKAKPRPRPRPSGLAAPDRPPVGISGELPLGDYSPDLPPEVTTSELEAMFNRDIPPPGMYDKNDPGRDAPGWLS